MNKFFVAGGVAMAAVAFVAKLAYEKYFNQHEPLPKQVVVKKLIDIREHLYPILFEIASLVAQKLVPKGVLPDQAKLFIMENDQLAFKQSIEKVLKEKVYYDVDEDNLEYAIETTYKDDKEVQFYKRAFQEQYEKCFLGIKPENLTVKMVIINKQTLLKIVASLLENKILKLKQILINCQEQVSKLDKQPSEERRREIFAEKLSQELAKDENHDDEFRFQLLQQHKINDIKTFEFAVAKFLQESPHFKFKYDQLQTSFKQQTQVILAHF